METTSTNQILFSKNLPLENRILNQQNFSGKDAGDHKFTVITFINNGGLDTLNIFQVNRLSRGGRGSISPNHFIGKTVGEIVEQAYRSNRKKESITTIGDKDKYDIFVVSNSHPGRLGIKEDGSMRLIY